MTADIRCEAPSLELARVKEDGQIVFLNVLVSLKINCRSDYVNHKHFSIIVVTYYIVILLHNPENTSNLEIFGLNDFSLKMFSPISREVW